MPSEVFLAVATQTKH